MRNVKWYFAIVFGILVRDVPQYVAAVDVVAQSPSQQYYICLSGDDDNAGSIDAPFRTLEAARDTIRAKKKSARPHRFTVWLRGGIYERERTFGLTDEDSGTVDSHVVYREYPGEDVRIVGGRQLQWSGFKVVTDTTVLARLAPNVRGRVLQLNLRAHGVTEYGPAGLTGGLEFFCNGRRMESARWPNAGWAQAHRGEPYRSVETEFTFEFSGPPPRPWQDASETFLHGYWRNDYRTMVIRPAKMALDPRRLTFAEGIHDGPPKGRRFYAFNVLEELDNPGEWYLDRDRGTLYFLPPDNRRDVSLFVSLLATPLVKSHDAAFVTLRDLTFEVARGNAIYLIGGSNNQIAGCTIRNVANDAIVLHGGRATGVSGCDLYDLGSGGVVVMGGDRKTLTPGDLYVVNNHIHHFSRLGRAYLPAVHLRDGVGNRAAHNLIHDAPHCGILYSGNDHVIEYNELHHLVLDASDAGVIYSGFDWTSRGHVVRHNFFHHIPHPPDGYTRVVYLDDAHSSTATLGNVFYKTHQSVWIGGGRDNRVENNVFIDCKEPVNIDNRGLRWAFLNPDGDLRKTRMYKQLLRVGYNEPPWSQRYPKLASILKKMPRAPLGNTLKRNIYVRSHWRNPEKWCRERSPRHVDTPYMDIVDNFATEENPGFVDAGRLNFALRPDSVVFREVPGFESIPFEKIGLYVDADRKSLPTSR